MPQEASTVGVTLIEATPGERVNSLLVGMAPSPFGACLIAESPHGICHLSFFDPGGETAALDELRALWLTTAIEYDHARAKQMADEIFSPARRSSPPIRVFACGTEFQRRVWRALLDVPSGATVSYAQLAAAIGNPQAYRATGSAVGANPVSFLIPCHRVIRSDGTIGQYRWGADRKPIMLAWEKSAC